MRSGDLDIYTMNADGSGTKRLAREKVTTADRSSRGTEILVSSSVSPEKRRELREYESLLGQNLMQTHEGGNFHYVRRTDRTSATDE